MKASSKRGIVCNDNNTTATEVNEHFVTVGKSIASSISNVAVVDLPRHIIKTFFRQSNTMTLKAEFIC